MKVGTFNKGVRNKGTTGLLLAQTAVAGMNEHRFFSQFVTYLPAGALTVNLHLCSPVIVSQQGCRFTLVRLKIRAPVFESHGPHVH